MYRVSKIPGFPRCPVPAASGVFARRGDRERHGSLPGRQRFQVISEQGKAPGEAGGGKKIGKEMGDFMEMEKGSGGFGCEEGAGRGRSLVAPLSLGFAGSGFGHRIPPSTPAAGKGRDGKLGWVGCVGASDTL